MQLLLEVHVPHPHLHAAGSSLDLWASSSTAFAIDAWEHKLGEYGGLPAGPFELIPAVASSFGAWHPDLLTWVKRLIGQIVDSGPVSAIGSPGAAKAALWRFACSLSITLQRGNFAMLAPTFGTELDAETLSDRLANPLSEEPEFWRCGPYSALSWTTEAL